MVVVIARQAMEIRQDTAHFGVNNRRRAELRYRIDSSSAGKKQHLLVLAVRRRVSLKAGIGAAPDIVRSVE